MTCDAVGPELVGFHLGAVDLVAREAIEGHLLGCRACLARYLGVKRSLEDAPLQEASPSPELRVKIRREVAALVVPAPVRALRPAWVLGAMAAAAAIFLVAFELGAGRLRLHPAARTTATTQAPLIDSEQADTSLKVL